MNLVDRYVQAALVRACLLVGLGLTGLFSLFAFVDQLGFVGHGHYRLVDALAFVLLTAPDRLVQITPVAMLLGCLLALGTLGREGELVAMRGLGISETRIMRSAMAVAGPVLLVLFVMAEFVIPPAQRLADEGRTSALSSIDTTRSADSFWAAGNGHYLNVERFEDGNVPADIDIYDFDGDGTLTTFLHASHADIRPDGRWILSDVVRRRAAGGVFETTRAARFAWTSFLSTAETELLILPPSSMPPVALYRYVRHLRQTHREAMRYEEEIWARIAIPISTAAMILIAAPFVFAPPRSQSTGYQLTVGAAIGLVFSLLQQIALRLDLLLDLDPSVLALGPSVLLVIVAASLFLAVQR